MPDAALPDKLRAAFEPGRYKVFYGGRGSGKSWGVARSLLIKASEKPLRVLCARETQKSIQESVHRLLKDQIGLMGLDWFYEVQETRIVGKNGSEFLFAGIRQQGVANLKSYEGCDVCWVEEAQVVTKKSWDILIPTIRKPNSEFFIVFNPELDSDETYLRFVVSPPEGAHVVKMNWSDNKWFPPELEQERTSWLSRDPIGYKTVWEGECRPAVEGAIYAEEVTKAIEGGRICPVPYDPGLKVHAIWDLGWDDSVFIILAQKHLSALRVIEVIEDDHKTYDCFSAELKNKRLNWGKMWLPHDAMHASPESGRTPNRILQDLGWTTGAIPNQPVETGIKAARQVLPQIYFDKVKADRLIQCLKRYRRNIPTTTGEPSTPVHDEYSHGADALRYLALVAPMLSNEEMFAKKIKYPSTGVV